MYPATFSSKFHIPGLAENHVSRQDLIERLNAGTPLSLVSAPAGYGKSSCVSEWTISQDRKILWYSIDASDNDFYAFCKSIADGLKQNWSIPNFELAELLQSPQRPNKQASVQILFRDLLLLNDLTLILDDYHLITNEDIHQLIMELVSKHGAEIKTVLISRNDPPFPLADYRVKDIVTEIRTHNLAFDGSNTEKLLARTSSVDASIVEKVTSLTEGWIAGLKLMTYGVRNRQDVISRLEGLGKSADFSFKSLVQYFLSRQDERVKRAVLRMSFLNSFCEGLMDAVFNSDSGSSLITELKKASVFIIRLDDRENWYRFHHLFQDSLQEEAQKHLSDSEITEVYSRAGEWMGGHGYEYDAIKFFLKANAKEQALVIWIKLRVQLINSSRWIELKSAYELLKPYKEHISLQLTKAWLLINEGHTMDMFTLVEDLSKSIDEWRKDPNYRTYLGELNALLPYKSYNIDQDYDSCIEQCELAFANLEDEFVYPKGYAWIFLIGSYQIKGRMNQAEEVAFSALKKGVSKIEESHIWLVLCFIYWFECDLEKLNTSAANLLEFGEVNNSKESYANGAFFLAMEHYVRGEWKPALKFVNQVLQYGNHTIGIIKYSAYLIKAAIIEKSSDFSKVNRLIEELKRETFLQGNELMMLFVKGYQIEMKLLQNEWNEVKYFSDELQDLPRIPITNFTDPHFGKLKANIYLGLNLEWTEEALIQLEAFLMHTHNRRFLIEVNCMQAMFQYKSGEIEKAHFYLEKGLGIAARFSLITPFLDSGPLMYELFKSYQGELAESDFLSRIKKGFQHRKKNQLDINISRREMDILRLMTDKMSNQEIGEKLFISEKTVKNHSNSIFKKLSVKNRKEAAHKAVDLGLLN